MSVISLFSGIRIIMASKRIYLCGQFLLFLAFYYVHAQDETKTMVTNVIKRLRLLEQRVHMETDLLRQEFQNDLALIPKLSNEDDSGLMKLQAIAIEGEINAFEKRVSDSVNSMKMGLTKEKVYRRDLEEQLKKMADESEVVRDSLEVLFNAMLSKIDILTKSVDHIGEVIKASPDSPANTQASLAQDCAELLRRGHVTNGVYTVNPDSMWRPLDVFCDMETDDGGWTVFQRRQDGSEDFYRSWMDYRFGFGKLSGEFWLGNEFIQRLVSRAPHELRIELEDFENDRRYAKYLLFSVGSEDNGFKLSIEGFLGNVTDTFETSPHHNGKQFSTKDRGPSQGCASSYKGGFWYGGCHSVNINGLYLKGKHKSYADGVNWSGFKGQNYSLKFTEMKFRPK